MIPDYLFDLDTEDEQIAQPYPDPGFDIDQALADLRSSVHREAGEWPESHYQALSAALKSLSDEYRP